MDPVANLNEQREIAARIQALHDHEHCADMGKCWQDREPCPFTNEDEQTQYIDDAARLAELVIALDEWRLKGGYDVYGQGMVIDG